MGSIYKGGKLVVKSATGNEVQSNEIGGAEKVSNLVTIEYEDWDAMRQAGTLDLSTEYSVLNDPLDEGQAQSYNTLTDLPRINGVQLVGDIGLNTIGAAPSSVLDLIPSDASSTNKLVTQAWGNSTVSTLLANRVTYTATGDPAPTVADLLSATTLYFQGQPYTPKTNDYIAVLEDENFGGASTRYTFDGVQWIFALVTNQTPFTNAQNLSINSQWNSTLTAQTQIVLNGLVYSSTPVPTGEVWTDGNPVYRVVLSGTTGGTGTANTFTNFATLPNFANFVEITGWLLNSTGSMLNNGFYNAQNGACFSLAVSNTGGIQYFFSSSSFQSRPIQAIVKYTQVV
jgi:hypothetical protein